MSYTSKRVPRVKQAEALKRLVGREHFALLMSMRTGKTKVTVDDFGRLVAQGEVDDFLGIAPAGVYETWKDGFEDDFDPLLFPILKFKIWRADDRGKRVEAELREFMEYRAGPRALMINVEALSSVKRLQELVIEYVHQRRVYAAVDESTTIKNVGSKRTQFVLDEIKPAAEWRRILTGLVSPRDPLDLFGQFEFLDEWILLDENKHLTTYRKRAKAFVRKYAVTREMNMGGRRFRTIVGWKKGAVEELANRISPHSFRVRLEDCYDVPDKMYAKREVQMTAEQARIYNDIKKKATATLENQAHVTATEVIVQLLRLHQILCGHVVDEEGVTHYIPHHRIDALLDVLAEHEGKAVIWCSYDFSIQEVTEALEGEYGEGSVARFWGGNKKTREAEEKRFKTDPRCLFMVATPAAGGRGREWSLADLVVYYSSTPDLEHRSQSEDRAQAVGKTRPVLYVDLLVPKTIDWKFVRVLRHKIDVSTTINGDNYKEWLI